MENKSIDTIFKEILINIHNFALSIIGNMEKIFSTDDTQTKLILNDDIVIPPEHNNYNGIAYDIYYYFLTKQTEGYFDGFHLSEFDFSGSFDININNMSVIIRIMANPVNNVGIYTCALLNRQLIEKPFDDYQSFYKKQISYNSIINEIYKIKRKMTTMNSPHIQLFETIKQFLK